MLSVQFKKKNTKELKLFLKIKFLQTIFTNVCQIFVIKA